MGMSGKPYTGGQRSRSERCVVDGGLFVGQPTTFSILKRVASRVGSRSLTGLRNEIINTVSVQGNFAVALQKKNQGNASMQDEVSDSFRVQVFGGARCRG